MTNPSNCTKTAYLLEDHALTRLGLKSLLSNSFQSLKFIGESASIERARTEISALKPDLVVTDLQLADGMSTEFIQQLKKSDSGPQVIVITQSDCQATRDLLLNSGVSAVILKSSSSESVLETFSHSVFHANSDQTSDTHSDADQIFKRTRRNSGLTPREQSVVRLITQGHTTKEIAFLLGCSSETVKSHKSSILSKTGSRNSAEVSAWAVKNQFV